MNMVMYLSCLCGQKTAAQAKQAQDMGNVMYLSCTL